MVDGRLSADVVAELERVVATLSGPVCLELAGLRSVDEAGLGGLRALLARGVVVTGASQYFRLLLKLDDTGKVRESPSRAGGRKGTGERGRSRTQ
jgi:hypothetical protein